MMSHLYALCQARLIQTLEVDAVIILHIREFIWRETLFGEVSNVVQSIRANTNEQGLSYCSP